MNKSELRRTIRKKRLSLSLRQQKTASLKLFLKVSSHPLFRKAKNLGFYFANNGEISPDKIFELAIKKNKQCYSAALQDDNTMVFRKYSGLKSLETHKYGFKQPNARCKKINVKELDLVFVPLVAFNSQGDRLGMGGGFYDRVFEYKKNCPSIGPKLIGLAHGCQKTVELEAQAWDIQMNYICTDEEIMTVKRK